MPVDRWLEIGPQDDREVHAKRAITGHHHPAHTQCRHGQRAVPLRTSAHKHVSGIGASVRGPEVHDIQASVAKQTGRRTSQTTAIGSVENLDDNSRFGDDNRKVMTGHGAMIASERHGRREHTQQRHRAQRDDDDEAETRLFQKR